MNWINRYSRIFFTHILLRVVYMYTCIHWTVVWTYMHMYVHAYSIVYRLLDESARFIVAHTTWWTLPTMIGPSTRYMQNMYNIFSVEIPSSVLMFQAWPSWRQNLGLSARYFPSFAPWPGYKGTYLGSGRGVDEFCLGKNGGRTSRSNAAYSDPSKVGVGRVRQVWKWTSESFDNFAL